MHARASESIRRNGMSERVYERVYAMLYVWWQRGKQASERASPFFGKLLAASVDDARYLFSLRVFFLQKATRQSIVSWTAGERKKVQGFGRSSMCVCRCFCVLTNILKLQKVKIMLRWL